MKKFFSWLGTFVIGYFGSIVILCSLVTFLHLVGYLFIWNWEYLYNNYMELVNSPNCLKWLNGIGIVCGLLLMSFRLELSD